MKRILLIGNGPLPGEKSGIRSAAGLRTFQFLEGVRKNGNGKVALCSVLITGDESKKNVSALTGQRAGTDENIFRIKKDDPKISHKLQKIHDDFEPEVIIGVN